MKKIIYSILICLTFCLLSCTTKETEEIYVDNISCSENNYYSNMLWEDINNEHWITHYNFEISDNGSTLFTETFEYYEYAFDSSKSKKDIKTIKSIKNLKISSLDKSGDKISSIKIGNMKFISTDF